MFYYKDNEFINIENGTDDTLLEQGFASTDDEKTIADVRARVEQYQEQQAEEMALKPTVDDLAEALDILTNIVLGGE